MAGNTEVTLATTYFHIVPGAFTPVLTKHLLAA